MPLLSILAWPLLHLARPWWELVAEDFGLYIAHQLLGMLGSRKPTMAAEIVSEGHERKAVEANRQW